MITASTLACSTALTGAVAAQEPQPSFWLTGGLGGGVFDGGDLGTAEGLTALAQLTYRSGRHVLSARGAVIAEILGDGVADVGVLYGRSAGGESAHASASAGLGMTFFEDCPGGLGSGSCGTDVTLGFPIALTLSWRPTPFLGLGIQALGNVNASHSFAAGAFVVELGRLR